MVWGIATGPVRPYDAAVNDPSAAAERSAEPVSEPPADAVPKVGLGTDRLDPPPTSLAAEAVMPVAKPSKPLWQRIPVGWIIFGVIVFGGAIGGLIFNASRGSSGEIDRGGNLLITDLRVGDCFDLKDPAADEVEEVSAVPCAQEHEYELMHVGVMPDGDYPTDAQFSDWLDANCTPAFEAYIGSPYETSIYEVSWFSPTSIGWLSGDHTVQCAVSHPTERRLTGSLRGVGG